jgi:hypothetical protein
MLKDFQSILVATVAAAALTGAVSGCSDSDTKAATTAADAGSEAGCPAGCPATDAGCPAKEAGCPAKEAGCPAGCPAGTPGDANTPPTGAAKDIDAWAAKGDYLKGNWKCEPAVRSEKPEGSSPHAKVKVCSNDKAAAYTSGQFAVGAATVKELYKADGTTLDGIAISLKTKAGTGGDSWYWYERIGASVIANSAGNTTCIGCHSKAGASGNPGGDYTFTIVK